MNSNKPKRKNKKHPPIKPGDKFGRLVVIKEGERYRGHRKWVCRCDCGGEKTVQQGHLRTGHTSSCGCLSRELAAERRTTHGLSGTPEYHAWFNAKRRCENPRDAEYKRYGERGIRMCDSWSNSVEAFIADMGPRPDGLTLERREVDDDYCPENCVWADRSTQNRNQRKKPGCSSKYRGVSWHKPAGKWRAQINIDGEHKHLGLFDIEEDAARAYDAAGLANFDADALVLNFPELLSESNRVTASIDSDPAQMFFNF